MFDLRKRDHFRVALLVSLPESCETSRALLFCEWQYPCTLPCTTHPVRQVRCLGLHHAKSISTHDHCDWMIDGKCATGEIKTAPLLRVEALISPSNTRGT